ncbi:MAG TPA: Mrp/NBP35 family ATP-binding protein [Candidatus Acidoferrum sp.]|nr:Mrp/NBP35 family ATP-binding protein [Candidatus Acidoferrum sp.]
MANECTHDCSTCTLHCADRKEVPGTLLAPCNKASKIGKVIGVVSGKGGVGKSLVTSLLAVATAKKGYRTAILDADITGPSIPAAFGIKGKAEAGENGLIPAKSPGGISVMSINLLLDHTDDAVIWRGPVVAGAVKQFWSDVAWGDVDYMYVDMPPGTGDVALTVFQSLPVDGVIVVSTPQDLVGMIVEKAVNMAAIMKVPVLALVENMSSFRCPDCGSVHYIYGKGHADEIAKKHGIPAVFRLPIEPELARLTDAGRIEDAKTETLAGLADTLTA